MAQELDQAQRRKHITLRDQFGRKWESTIDTISQGTCAPINPRGWNDPLNTPSKYVVLTKDEDGNLALEVQLDQWASQLEQDHKEYDQRLYNDAMMLFGAAGPQEYKLRSPALLNYTGEPPQPLEPVLAASVGDQWALGQSKDDKNNIQRFFPKQETAREKFLRSLQDIEEQEDPDATGGKREPIRRAKKAVEV